MASKLFSPEAWRRDPCTIKSPVCNYGHNKKTIFNHGLLSASHSNLMNFSFLSERSWRRRPPAERSALYCIPVCTAVPRTCFRKTCCLLPSVLISIVGLIHHTITSNPATQCTPARKQLFASSYVLLLCGRSRDGECCFRQTAHHIRTW